MGDTWPVDGRTVGIVVGDQADLADVAAVRAALIAAKVTPLLIAPSGGTLSSGPDGLPIQRTYLTARAAELDAVVVTGLPSPAHPIDPRVALLLAEAYRHGKALLALNGSASALSGLGLPTDAAGVLAADGAASVPALVELMSRHRAWERFAQPSPG